MDNKLYRGCTSCIRLHNLTRDELDCRLDLLGMALNLINRQKAEIERLNGELVDRGLLPTITLYDYNTKQIRAEAINAYADEVQKRCIEGGIFPVLVKKAMDDVRKEMVGE